MSVQQDDAQVWSPKSLDPAAPPYLALLSALEDDIRRGSLAVGARLPPHRTLAADLGISISTVSKAYREASQRGLIDGRTGQGTFVLPQKARESISREMTAEVNLGFNLAPKVRERDVVNATLAEIVRGQDVDNLFAYRTPQDFTEQRIEIARWLKTKNFSPEIESVVMTNGAQHGIDLAIELFGAREHGVLVEELTYGGFKAASESRNFPMFPVAMDHEGLIPEALEAAILSNKARVLYTMPTLQSPTARTMSVKRRREIADIAEKHGIYIIEDDVYRFLSVGDNPPLASFCPERTICLTSFSKILGLGFRLGVMIVPPAFVDRANMAVRASAWTTVPMLVDVLTRLIRNGKLDELVREVAKESAARVDLFRKVFKGRLEKLHEPAMGYHVWLPLPANWSAQDLFYKARNAGVLITPPGSAIAGTGSEPGVRLCVGGAPNRAALERALRQLSEILDHSSNPLLSFI